MDFVAGKKRSRAIQSEKFYVKKTYEWPGMAHHQRDIMMPARVFWNTNSRWKLYNSLVWSFIWVHRIVSRRVCVCVCGCMCVCVCVDPYFRYPLIPQIRLHDKTPKTISNMHFIWKARVNAACWI